MRIRKTREKNGSGSDRLEKTILRTDPRKKPRIQNRTLPYFDIIKLVFYLFFRHKSQYIEILVMHYKFITSRKIQTGSEKQCDKT